MCNCVSYCVLNFYEGISFQQDAFFSFQIHSFCRESSSAKDTIPIYKNVNACPIQERRVHHHIVVVRGSIEMDLQSSEVTEQEIDEQDDCLLWHDRLSELKDLDC
jgi:hypothetical protein